MSRPKNENGVSRDKVIRVRLTTDEYNLLISSIGDVSLSKHIRGLMFKNHYDKSEIKGEPSKNRPCPCGSGKKYKHCCMKTS